MYLVGGVKNHSNLLSRILIMLLTLLLIGIAVQSAAPFLSPYPSHASCRIDWTFGMGCSDVAEKIKQQIEAWKGDDCGSGEKCLYKFESFEKNVLKAKHETPKSHYLDDLSFTFTDNKSTCSVEGFSTSETWYAYLDYSTNYCNLHNLISGAGLTKVQGYSEKTSNSRCTQYTSRKCDKY